MSAKEEKYDNETRLTASDGKMPFMYFTVTHPSSTGNDLVVNCRLSGRQASYFCEDEKGNGIKYFYVIGGWIKDKDVNNNGVERDLIQVKRILKTYRR